MGDERPVLDYTTPREKPRHLLPLPARIACGIIAVPVTYVATLFLGHAVQDWEEVSRRGTLVGTACVFAFPVLWWLAGIRLCHNRNR